MAIGFNLPDIGRRISPEETGIPDYVAAITKGMQAGYLPRQLENQAVESELANRIKMPYAANAKRAFEADIGGQEANAGLTLQNLYKQKILNEFLREREPAEINLIKGQAKYYEQGGPGQGTGGKYYNNYLNGIAKDNPGLNQQQLDEAANVIASGGNQLADGTQLKPMSLGTRVAFDNAIKSTTTAGQINQANAANQADAELDVLTNFANEWRAPYAESFAGYSPQQIIDSFKSDSKSQTQLGELIASNAIEYEIAQVRNRLAGGQPGITSTQQLMQEAMQHINAVWPRLSPEARRIASQRLNEALKAGLAARNLEGSGAGNIYTRQKKEQNKGYQGPYKEKIVNGKSTFVPALENEKDPLGLGL